MAIRRFIVWFTVTMAICLNGVAQNKADFTPFDSPAEFREKLAALKDYLRYYGKHEKNTFYIAKLNEDPEEKGFGKFLYAYWPEQRSILLLNHLSKESSTDRYGQSINYPAHIFPVGSVDTRQNRG